MKLWELPRRWVEARLSTPAGRLGAFAGGLGGVTWYVDQHGEPPVYLLGALTAAVGAFLHALGAKREEQREQTEATAKRAEAKADEANDKAEALGRVAAAEHPDRVDDLTPPLPPEVKEGN